MASDAGHDASWSRAFMATSGIAIGDDGTRTPVPAAELREAQNSELSRERVMQLAQHRLDSVREAIAQRLDCPMGTLIALAHDRRSDVRIAAAANRSAARAVLEHLAKDKDASVLKAIARNPATPRDIVERLAFHKRDDVRRVASRQLDGADAGLGESAAASPIAVPAELRDRIGLMTLRATAAPPESDVDTALPQRAEPTTLAPRPVVVPRLQSPVGPMPPAPRMSHG